MNPHSITVFVVGNARMLAKFHSGMVEISRMPSLICTYKVEQPIA